MGHGERGPEPEAGSGRVSSKSKAKGTKGESDLVKYLLPYFPLAERRALNGVKDKGDIAGVPRPSSR